MVFVIRMKHHIRYCGVMSLVIIEPTSHTSSLGFFVLPLNWINVYSTLLPSANEIWCKVMFLHESVILITGERRSLYDVTSWLDAWSYVPAGVSLSLVPCILRRGLHLGVSVQGGLCQEGIWRETPRIRKVGSMHPTGMLSCNKVCSSFETKRSQQKKVVKKWT